MSYLDECHWPDETRLLHFDDGEVHGSARVFSDVVLGVGSRVYAFAAVMKGAKIGAGCTIGQGAHVGSRVTIGDRCKVQNGAQLFEGVHLHEGVFVGPHAVFTNVLTPRAHVDRRAEFKDTHVARGASIGANATILCGVTIGEYALVGAGSVVTHDVWPHAIVVGNPARHTGWACRCGEKLSPTLQRGRAGERTCATCGDLYKVAQTSAELLR